MAQASPMQQFIENYMQVQQFQQREKALLEQQRQFDTQQALAMRQQENSEITAFANIAGQVRNQNELGAVAEYFSSRSPNQAPVFQQLATNIGQTIQTQMGNAMSRLGPGFAEQAVGIQFDTQLGARGQEQARQYDTGLAQDESQFTRRLTQDDSHFTQNIRQNAAQFGANMGQRRYEFGETMGFNRAQLAQQGALSQSQMLMSAMPEQAMRGQLSQEAESIRTLLEAQGGAMRPEARTGMERQLRDLNAQIGRFDNIIAAQATKGSTAGMNRNQLYSARAAAFQDILEAQNTATKQAATEAYNQISEALGLSGLQYTTEGRNRFELVKQGEEPQQPAAGFNWSQFGLRNPVMGGY